MEWLKKYLDSQFLDGNLYSFKDLLEIKIILNDKNNYAEFIRDNCMIMYDYNQISKINLINNSNLNCLIKRNKIYLVNNVLKKTSQNNRINVVQKNNFSSFKRNLHKNFSTSDEKKTFIYQESTKEKEKESEENFAKYMNKAVIFNFNKILGKYRKS